MNDCSRRIWTDWRSSSDGGGRPPPGAVTLLGGVGGSIVKRIGTGPIKPAKSNSVRPNIVGPRNSNGLRPGASGRGGDIKSVLPLILFFLPPTRQNAGHSHMTCHTAPRRSSESEHSSVRFEANAGVAYWSRWAPSSLLLPRFCFTAANGVPDARCTAGHRSTQTQVDSGLTSSGEHRIDVLINSLIWRRTGNCEESTHLETQAW